MEPMHKIPARGGLNYDETPFLAIWEVTQSCDLACKHCRAAAQPIAHPDAAFEHAEGKGAYRPDCRHGSAYFYVHGGRPDEAQDLYELIRYGAEKNVKMALTPSATPLLTREAIFKLKEAGLVRLGISLDGSTRKFTIISEDCRAPGRGRSRLSSGQARPASRSRYIQRSAGTTPTISMTFALCSRSWPS